MFNALGSINLSILIRIIVIMDFVGPCVVSIWGIGLVFLTIIEDILLTIVKSILSRTLLRAHKG